MDKKLLLKRVKSGVFILFLLFIGAGVIKAVIRHGPRQINIQEDYAQNYGVNLVLNREKKTAKIEKQIGALPPFVPPANGIITKEQMRKYVKVIYYLYGIQEESTKRRPKGMLDLGPALMVARVEVAVALQSEAEQLYLAKMSHVEYVWIDDQVKKAVALAMLRLSEKCYVNEKPENFVKTLNWTAVMAQYSKKDETNSFVPAFEKLDPSEIPEANYVEVLAYYRWIKYYPDTNLSQFDFPCLMRMENVQEADFTPPEIVYPNPEK